MSTAQIIGLTVAAVAYLTSGMFVSRWYWHNHIHNDWGEPELMAFAIVFTWPFALAFIALGRFVKWFYRTT